MTVFIKIDYSKCSEPLRCAKCLEVCSPIAIIAKPIRIEKFKETPHSEYRIVPRYRAVCNLCRRCEEVCPEKAISVTLV